MDSELQLGGNPVRKVITMLEHIKDKVEEEGRTEEDLYKKFMCYCKKTTKSLTEGIAESKERLAETEKLVESSRSELDKKQAAVTQGKQERNEAREAIKNAEERRKRQASENVAKRKDLAADIKAIKSAIKAINKGIEGSLIQSSTTSRLRAIVLVRASAEDQRMVQSFLSGSSEDGYVPQSGEILGILSHMQDILTKELADTAAQEEEARKVYEHLVAAKKGELEMLSTSLENDVGKVGNLEVQFVQSTHTIKATGSSLKEDLVFSDKLAHMCKEKVADWEERSKLRSEELLALSETIAALGNDDSLDLLKKTLSPDRSSLMQMQVTAASTARAALAKLRGAPVGAHQARWNLITMALHGKKIAFESVIGMIDKLVADLRREQKGDQTKKVYCTGSLASTHSKKKNLAHVLQSGSFSIRDLQAQIAQRTEDRHESQAQIRDLDAATDDLTKQRQREHAEHVKVLADDTAAMEVLRTAVNRLQKFYNPEVYREQREKVARTGEYDIPGGMFVQVRAVVEVDPAAPKTYGEYTTQTDKSSLVLKMLNVLMKDLAKEMSQATAQEKASQQEYEATVSESAKRRKEIWESFVTAGRIKARVQEDLLRVQEKTASDTAEFEATNAYLQALHSDCDWLLENYDAREEARAAEVDSLRRARAVLTGADYSLIQTHETHAQKFLAIH